MPDEDQYTVRPYLFLFLTGTALFVLYYLADCALDSLIFGEGTFAEHLFAPTAHEVAIRSLSGIFLFTLYLVSAILISRNRALQQDLLVKTQEIIQRNRELDTYNHTLSHQLQSALTRIMLSKERLKFDCFQCSSKRGKEMLGQLSDDCDQLSDRINAMLGYADANRAILERKRVAIDDLVREIARGLTGPRGTRPLDFQIDNNLETECDPGLMQLALKKLIDCSVQSTSHNRHGEVRIGMKKRGGVPIYFIRTTRQGEAIDPAQGRTRCKMPEFAHTMINIKTARSIIERHGGQLWAKDAANGSPTFYFTL